MAKKTAAKKKPEKKKLYSDYPIKALFQFSTLAAAVAFVVLYVNNPSNIIEIFFQSFLVFSSVSIAGGLVMVSIFSVLGNLRKKEHEEYVEQLKKQADEILEEKRKLFHQIQLEQMDESDDSNAAALQ